MWQLVIRLFITVSERFFLRWYDSLKAKEKAQSVADSPVTQGELIEILRDGNL